jgi:50S ribosomal subunit-associated GTPase HflX
MRPVIIAITKVDAVTYEQRKRYAKMSIDRKRPMLISAVTGEAIPDLVSKLWHTILEGRKSTTDE